MDLQDELLASIIRAQAADNATKQRDATIARQTQEIAKLRRVIDELKQIIDARNTQINHWYNKACIEQQAAGEAINELADLKAAIKLIREVA